MRQYISDIITEEEMLKWENGDKILITAQCGSGKSEFIKTKMAEYCEKRNIKCLLLSNRKILRDQNKEDLGYKKQEYIHARNYQALEKRVLNGTAIETLFQPYQVIVWDEIHYMFSDAQFSRNTDALISSIKEKDENRINIFITATPEVLLEFQSEYDYNYTIKSDYSYIKDLCFYNNDSIVENILLNLDKNDKAIFFSSNAKDAYNISKKIDNAAFICSSNNDLKYKSNKSVIDQIITNSKFDNQILCTTKILDNGVNIKDENLNILIVDMLDPISMLQEIGRKRILGENDKITLYIKNYHNGIIGGHLRRVIKNLSYVEERRKITPEDFQSRYRKKEFDIVIDNDYQINIAKLYNYKFQLKYLNEMFNNPDGDGYKRYICNLLDVPFSKARKGEFNFKSKSIEGALKELCNKQLFREDILEFKSMFASFVDKSNRDSYKRLGYKSINSILVELGLNYEISPERERTMANRDKSYWIIRKKRPTEWA
jgi:superfamily II DNA or RNA helicase